MVNYIEILTGLYLLNGFNIFFSLVLSVMVILLIADEKIYSSDIVKGTYTNIFSYVLLAFSVLTLILSAVNLGLRIKYSLSIILTIITSVIAGIAIALVVLININTKDHNNRLILFSVFFVLISLLMTGINIFAVVQNGKIRIEYTDHFGKFDRMNEDEFNRMMKENLEQNNHQSFLHNARPITPEEKQFDRFNPYTGIDTSMSEPDQEDEARYVQI